MDIPKIDDADQSYVADIFLRYDWNDERLANGRDTPCTVLAADVWNPDVLVVNRRNVERQMNEVVEIQPDGAVRYVQRFYGTFSLPLDLSRFPFDRQQLILHVRQQPPDRTRLVELGFGHASDKLVVTFIQVPENQIHASWLIRLPAVRC